MVLLITNLCMWYEMEIEYEDLSWVYSRMNLNGWFVPIMDVIMGGMWL
jgi:hypothetical protein